MFLDDVTVTHDGDTSRVEYRGIVCTVQPNESRRAAIDRAAGALFLARGLDAIREAERVLEQRKALDAWSYSLPANLAHEYADFPGQSVTFSHPSRAGALHMCRKAFVGAGVILVPHDDSHMDETDRGIAFNIRKARAEYPGPVSGDFVRLPSGRVRRICGIGFNGETFGLTDGGSFGINASLRAGGGASYSGGLDWQDGWTLARLHATGETGKGRFWFFSHGRPAAGGGVDVAIDCRIWELRGES